MPPLIYNTDNEGYPKPFQYLHPGIKKTTFTEKIHQAPVFQQSVTLTASMWNENDSTGNMDWSFDNWRVLGKYSPLYIGLVCGFGIVLLIMSSVMLWRYCLLSASRKVCCKGTYGEITQHQKSLPLRKKSIVSQSEFENCSDKLWPIGSQQTTLQRSFTVGSLFSQNASKPLETKNELRLGNSTNNIISHLHLQSTPLESLTCSDFYTSHLYLQKLNSVILETPKNLSKSTPALEDLYSKVNFSKKKKNRMRKNDAAIIAMSKSQRGQNNNSLEIFGSAVVVYNERTAL